MTLAIGIDVGGTKIAAGLVDVRTGQVAARQEIQTRPMAGGVAVLEGCFEMASRLAEQRPISVGIAICELVDLDGHTASAATIDWRDIDVPARFASIGPCALESDVRAAALAEACFGHGRGTESFLFVVAGTGMSCSLVDRGEPRKGRSGRAVLLGPPGLEAAYSGGALMRQLGTADLRAVVEDPERSSAIEAAAAELGRYLAVLINALDVGLVVFGGGLGGNPQYRAWVQMAADQELWPGGWPVRYEGSALGADGGVIGAAVATARAE